MLREKLNSLELVEGDDYFIMAVEGVYPCLCCNKKSFETPDELLRHYKTHTSLDLESAGVKLTKPVDQVVLFNDQGLLSTP